MLKKTNQNHNFTLKQHLFRYSTARVYISECLFVYWLGECVYKGRLNQKSIYTAQRD